MDLALFSFMDSTRDSLVELGRNCLLVAGGFLVGYILGGLGGWATGKWVFKLQSTDSFKRVGRPVGGILVAIIIALIVFTGLGKSPGEGGDGKGNLGNDPANKSNPRDDQKANSKVVPPNIDPTPPSETVRVTVLAGAAVKTERRYYLIDDDGKPKTLEELKEVILARKLKSKGKTTLAVLFSADPNLAPPRNDHKVTDLTRWATEEAGLDVTFSASK